MCTNPNPRTGIQTPNFFRGLCVCVWGVFSLNSIGHMHIPFYNGLNKLLNPKKVIKPEAQLFADFHDFASFK